MEPNTFSEYAHSKNKETESFQAEIRSKYNYLLDNDLQTTQSINKLWEALIDIQKRLNQLFLAIKQLQEETGSGKGSGQMKPKEVMPEPASEPTPAPTQEPQVQYQAKTSAQVQDRIASVRNQAMPQGHPTISQRYSPNQPGR